MWQANFLFHMAFHIQKRKLACRTVLSTHLRLGLPSGLFPSGFPTNNLFNSGGVVK
jgi:hypothetical protein